MNEFTLTRLYHGVGWLPGDFSTLRDNTVLVAPVKPPARAGLIHQAAETVEIPGTMAILYKVVAHGDLTRADDLKVNVGDTVALRNAMLDPIHSNLEMLTIDAKHIFSVVDAGGGS